MIIDIPALRELLSKASPQPWRVTMGGIRSDDRVFGIDAPDTTADYGSGPEVERNRIVETDCGVYPPELPDAALICAAVNALPELLDENERMQSALVEMKDWALNRAPGCSSTFSPATAAAIATICERALEPAVNAARSKT